MLSYSVGYSPPAESRPDMSQMLSELVGVAGFEPAASSSRTKRAAKLRYTPPARSLGGAGRVLDSLAERQARSGRTGSDGCRNPESEGPVSEVPG